MCLFWTGDKRFAKAKGKWVLQQCFNIVTSFVSFTPEWNKLIEGETEVTNKSAAAQEPHIPARSRTHPTPLVSPPARSSFSHCYVPQQNNLLMHGTSNGAGEWAPPAHHCQITYADCAESHLQKENTTKKYWSPAWGEAPQSSSLPRRIRSPPAQACTARKLTPAKHHRASRQLKHNIIIPHHTESEFHV